MLNYSEYNNMIVVYVPRVLTDAERTSLEKNIFSHGRIKKLGSCLRIKPQVEWQMLVVNGAIAYGGCGRHKYFISDDDDGVYAWFYHNGLRFTGKFESSRQAIVACELHDNMKLVETNSFYNRLEDNDMFISPETIIKMTYPDGSIDEDLAYIVLSR